MTIVKILAQCFGEHEVEIDEIALGGFLDLTRDETVLFSNVEPLV